MDTASAPSALAALHRRAAACTACPLHEGRTNAVFHDGDPASRLVLVGDAPRRSEDLAGRPFAGASGNLLDNLLLENGLTRSSVYLCMLVKCRVPEGRPPEPDEVAACSVFLREQLQIVTPRVIVALGAIATRVLLGRSLPIEKVAGYRFPAHGATLIPTYHLSDALRGSPQAMAALRRDVRTARGVLDGELPPAGESFASLRAHQQQRSTDGEVPAP